MQQTIHVMHTLGRCDSLILTRPLSSCVSPQAALSTSRSRQEVLSHPCRDHVHALVALEVPKGTAGKAAAVTFVGFLSSVDAQVSLQVDQLCRSIRAQRAVERLLPVVRLHVAFDVVGVAGRKAADVTGL